MSAAAITDLLVGRTVVVTRAAEQAGPLGAMLAAHGAEVLAVPLIEIVDPDDGGAALAEALGRLGSYEWIVVTSPNAASRVAGALSSAAPMPKVAAVGTATAAALPTVDLVASRQSAVGLIEAFADGAGSVLLPQSARARPGLADGLRSRGWTVHVVAAYDVIGIAPAADQRELVRGADALLLASGTAARAWADAFGQEAPPLVVAIGPQTAAAARQVGLKVHLTSSDHSPAGLVATLVAHFHRP